MTARGAPLYCWDYLQLNRLLGCQRLYRAQAGAYLNTHGAAQLLAERVEDIVAADTTRWASRREQAERGDKPEQGPG
ncbi:MAG: hypothetical protein ACRDSZ_25040 [Pseudonocardiaceae bacterium]